MVKRYPLRSPKLPTYAVAATFAAHAVLFASWTAHIPQVKAHLGLSDGALGTALLGAPIGSLVATVMSTWLLPRLGSPRIIRVTVAGYALGGIGVGLAGSPAMLFTALAVWGFFQGALDVAMNTQAVTVERIRKVPIMSRLHGLWSLGGFAGALIGAAAVAAGAGLTAQMTILGLMVVVVLEVLSITMISDERPQTTRRPVTTHTRRQLLSRTILVLGALAFLSTLCEGAAADWSAAYLRSELHTSSATAGLGYAAFALAMVTLRMAGPALQTRIAPRTLVPVLALVYAIGMSIALAVSNPIAALIGFACMGAGLGLVVPTAFAIAGSGDTHAGTAISIVSALSWPGFVSGPPLIGHLADLTGLTTALWVLPACAVVMAAIARFAKALRSVPAFAHAGR